MKNKTDIIFDLDHTLWDFDRNSQLAYERIFAEKKITLDIKKFIKVYEPLNLQYWRRFRESEITKEQLRYHRLKDAFDGCAYEVKDADLIKMADLYLDYLPEFNHLYADCVDVLEKLSQTYRLHILTNGFEEVQYRKLQRSGLDSFFDVVLTAERAGSKKPDPRIFNLVISEIAADKEQCVMVGDSLEADVQGAIQSGIDAIWFNPKNQSKEDIVEVKDLKGLLNFF